MSEESKLNKKDVLNSFYKTFTGEDYSGEEELTKYKKGDRIS